MGMLGKFVDFVKTHTTPPSMELRLTGQPAENAIGCMQGEGVLPKDPSYFYGDGESARVGVATSGAVFASNYKSRNGGGPSSAFYPSDGENPANARIEGNNTQQNVTGDAAETMRQKARACAMKFSMTP